MSKINPGCSGKFHKTQENNCVWFFFLNKVASLQPASLFKTRLRQKCFSVNFTRHFRFWGTHPDAYCGEPSRHDVCLHNLQNQFSEWKDKICQESIDRGNCCNSMIPLLTVDTFCRIRERKENNHIIFSKQPEKHPTWSPSILQSYQQLHHNNFWETFVISGSYFPEYHCMVGPWQPFKDGCSSKFMCIINLDNILENLSIGSNKISYPKQQDEIDALDEMAIKIK